MRVSLLLSVLAALVTVVLAIYMAQPWGDNYAYQSVSGYAVLVLFIIWALSPYIYLIYQSLRSQLSNSAVLSVVISAIVICLGGVFFLIDTAFFNIDAQGGLIFIFLPIYQWLLIGACRAVASLWGVLHAT